MMPQEKNLAQRSQTYHHHEMRRMRRAAEAKQLGLDIHEFAMPWPGNQTNVHNSGDGFWKGAVLSAALLAAGVGGGALLSFALTPQPSPPVSAATSDHSDASAKTSRPGSSKRVEDRIDGFEVIPP